MVAGGRWHRPRKFRRGRRLGQMYLSVNGTSTTSTLGSLWWSSLAAVQDHRRGPTWLPKRDIPREEVGRGGKDIDGPRGHCNSSTVLRPNNQRTRVTAGRAPRSHGRARRDEGGVMGVPWTESSASPSSTVATAGLSSSDPSCRKEAGPLRGILAIALPYPVRS